MNTNNFCFYKKSIKLNIIDLFLKILRVHSISSLSFLPLCVIWNLLWFRLFIKSTELFFSMLKKLLILIQRTSLIRFNYILILLLKILIIIREEMLMKNIGWLIILQCKRKPWIIMVKFMHRLACGIFDHLIKICVGI